VRIESACRREEKGKGEREKKSRLPLRPRHALSILEKEGKGGEERKEKEGEKEGKLESLELPPVVQWLDLAWVEEGEREGKKREERGGEKRIY